MEREEALFRIAGKPNVKKIILAVGFYGLPLALTLAAYLIFTRRREPSGKTKKDTTGPRVASKRLKNGIPPGLVNLGNTCFVNCLLQALSSLPIFCEWVDAFKAGKDKVLLDSLKYVLQVLNNKKETDRDVFSAWDVVHALNAHGWVISSQQQDTHEFFQVLMSTLEDEMLEDSKSNSHTFCFPSETLRKEQMIVSKSCQSFPVKCVEPDSPFKGTLANRMTCTTCGYKSVRFEPCESLSLRIPRTAALAGTTLERCLSDFIKSEIVDGVNCPGCTKKSNSAIPIKSSFMKQLSFAKVPSCLCLHIQRSYILSDGTSYKNSQFVRFTDILDLHPYRYNTVAYNANAPGDPATMSKHASIISCGMPLRGGNCNSSAGQGFVKANPSRSLYRLKAVIVHIGDVWNGHFVTYKRAINNDNKWVYLSDEQAKITSKQSVLSNTAYLLFYERMNDISS